ncbi:PaaI family thioesterase [Leptospira yasudae]|uniref:Thioesterase n=1 Tax=Leptospira yasudae TaxID=2202201 RepID=A0A6N4QX84_9LEPT|nr:hotdog domain-containing protein [Leptospira yasudae]TGL82132.1 thioesterase [Leptospira yasudae]TGL83229.1 thioesterase [Leptospira yasudae]TGL87489.1 thioesterase [Leptospira yasudae]
MSEAIAQNIEEHYRKLENMYHGAPVNEYFKPKLAIAKGSSELRIQIREDFFHAAGATHGVVYFKAADDAAFFAANSLVKGNFVLTSTFNLTLLRPIQTGILLAKGLVVQNATHQIIAEASLWDERGREVGRGIGNFAKSTIPLTPEIGYKL